MKNTIIDDLNYMIIEDNDNRSKSIKKNVRELRNDAYLDDEINLKVIE